MFFLLLRLKLAIEKEMMNYPGIFYGQFKEFN